MALPADIAAYHKALSATDRAICTKLATEIDAILTKAERKIWHRHPVWFLDGNPIVGYHRLKDNVRLMFWSGQGFDEPDLAKEGSFKAAEARYDTVDDIKVTALRRWLSKSKAIQYDYKNIMKNKGRLSLL